jgi:hypothetical protein
MSLVFLGLQFYEIATALLGFAAFCTAWVSGYFGSSFGRMQATFSLIGRLHNIRPIFFYLEMVTSLSVNRFQSLVTPSELLVGSGNSNILAWAENHLRYQLYVYMGICDRCIIVSCHGGGKSGSAAVQDLCPSCWL